MASAVSRPPGAEDRRQPTPDRRQSPAERRRPPVDIPAALTRRVVIECVQPQIDGGRFPIKRTVAEWVDVRADIFADGHDVVAAVLRDRHLSGFRVGDSSRESRIPSDASWRESPMRPVAAGTDAWAGRFDVYELGWHEYSIVAWVDRFESWRRDLEIKAAAGQDVALELLEGSLLVREAAGRAEGQDRAHADWLLARTDQLTEDTPAAERVAAALDGDLLAMMRVYAGRSQATVSAPLRVWVDRARARFGAWYEMFPRSAGPDPNRSGTFAAATPHLRYIADLGFDVVYLPPIHPIGTSFRKGRNNRLVAGPDDPGSPWAIGSEAGGHTSVEPGLGSLEDFIAFREEAERLGLEVALDLAFQSSPDHPWVREHPEWFRHRPDGSIKYAENPPKKYQDIYPLDFASDDWPALWRALLEVAEFWVERGIRIFRVDNPHTKTFGFWEWMIREVQSRHPDVIFLAEAFTRPKLMRYLAKCGFTQSYTYFTWRNAKQEIVDYFTELTRGEAREYFRPNLFTNTPDILHAYLQQGGRPAFETRLVLAATLGATYGIYSGFELGERRAVPGTEEYADSEKYQVRTWDWDRPGHVKELISRINRIRRRHRALQFDRTLRFHDTDNPQILAYSKTAPDGSDPIVVVVNLDPQHMQHGFVRMPAGELGIGAAQQYTVRDLLDDTPYGWAGEWNYVRFDPEVRQAHVMALEP